MHKLVTSALVLLLAAVSQTASAQTATDNRNAQIDRRQARQQARIDQGVASGRLTSSEAARLQQREANLDARQARANADGKVTRREQARLNRAENRSSRAIFAKKHNRRWGR
ncbi:MAG: hypothetical protein JSR82_22030 [Verrucomicrobia bacterium]|nr:hypothetical protein [Verrucomicrobiota bacterium]